MSITPMEAENIKFAVELDQQIKTKETIKSSDNLPARSLYKDIVHILCSCYKRK